MFLNVKKVLLETVQKLLFHLFSLFNSIEMVLQKSQIETQGPHLFLSL